MRDVDVLAALFVAALMQPMDPSAALSKTNVAQYVRYFETLGLDDPQKLQVLSRLLKVFFDIGSQLDKQLEPVGATLHSSISRLCEADNPSAPPRYRWIRVIDRLGLFGKDDHACRVVNIGLSYAYRQKELDSLTSANALRLEDLRRRTAAAGDTPEAAPPADAIPAGGILVAQRAAGSDGPAGGDLGVPGPGTTAAESSAAGLGAAGSGTALDAEDYSLLPPGGVVVARHEDNVPAEAGDGSIPLGGTAGAGAGASGNSGAPGDAADDANELKDGGIVVAWRPGAGQGPADSHRRLDGLGDSTDPILGDLPATTALGDDFDLIVTTSQPMVTPSEPAAKCVNAILEGLLNRKDSRVVLQQLVLDSLLCWGRLYNGAGQSSSTVLANANQAWAGVRNILHRW